MNKLIHIFGQRRMRIATRLFTALYLLMIAIWLVMRYDRLTSQLFDGSLKQKLTMMAIGALTFSLVPVIIRGFLELSNVLNDDES